MKLHTLISAVLLATVSSLSTVYAADGDKAPAEAPKMQPHSHMQEKTGIAPKAADAAPAEKADKAKPKHDKTKDKNRHLHPRDGKS
jgi:hypothetical protein